MGIFGRDEKQAAQDMQNAIAQAQGQIQSGFSEAKGYMQPYYDTGTSALKTYTDTLNKWLSNPINTYNAIMGQWSASPAAQMQTQQMIDASNAGAAASGMLGSGAQQTAMQQNAANITAADQERFFKDITGMGKAYLGGQQGLAQMGFQSAGTMGNWSTQEAEDLAQLSQQMGIAQAQGEMAGLSFDDILGAAMPSLFGGLKGGMYSGGYLNAPRGTTVQPTTTKGIIGGLLGV